MKREKIIKGIKECDLNGGLIGNCPYKGILDLLKEQEAVEPFCWNDDYGQHWKCGHCGKVIGANDKYCHECGKPVKHNEQQRT